VAGITVKFDLLLNIFAGKDDVLRMSSNAIFQNDLKCFLLYTITEIFVGGCAGVIISWLLLRRKWMIRSLMYNNIWYKLFTGMTLAGEKRKKIDSVFIKVFTMSKDITVIYMGMLEHYEVMPDSDNLSFLTLQSVKRQNSKDGQNYGPITPVPGDSLTIFGKDILNVTVTYMELITDPENPSKLKLSPIL
jgi:hypothetical protein